MLTLTLRQGGAKRARAAWQHRPAPRAGPTHKSICFHSLFTLLHFLLDLGYARQLHFRFSVLEGPKHGVCMCVFPLRAHTGFAVLFNFVFIVETQPSPKEESQEFMKTMKNSLRQVAVVPVRHARSALLFVLQLESIRG